MAETKTKGDLGQAIIVADLMKKGHKIAVPIGEDWRFDLIVYRDSKFERVQCKYTESDGRVIQVKTESTNNWVRIKYTKDDIDWIAVYDKTTDACYYLKSDMFSEGKSLIHLRLVPSKNNQIKAVHWAKDFLSF